MVEGLDPANASVTWFKSSCLVMVYRFTPSKTPLLKAGDELA